MMSTHRSWSIWWDFLWEDGEIKYVVVETNHLKYRHIPYIKKFSISECQNSEGYIDEWEETWFRPFESDIYAGRKSLHTVMKNISKNQESC